MAESSSTTPTTTGTPSTGTDTTSSTAPTTTPTNNATDSTPTGTTATTDTTPANSAAPTPTVSPEQQQKYTSAIDPNTMNGIPFNVYYGKLDSTTASKKIKQFTNGKNYCISCYFIPKFVKQ
jgi:hypothetical protein